jgi:transposase InsO family protein
MVQSQIQAIDRKEATMSFLHLHARSLWQNIKQRIRQWMKPDNHSPVLNTALDLTCSKSELMVENALLRQQLIIYQRETKRPKITWRDRALIVFLTSKLRGWKEAVLIVKPDTVLRWHRDLFRRVWRRKSKAKSKPGRPPLADELVTLIKRMARENPLWGAKRTHGELIQKGIEVSKSTIQKYVKLVRTFQTPDQTWATFVRNHASEIWACDFLQTYDIFFRTIFVFVIIEIGSRRIVHFGVTRHPTDQWTAQQLREATPFGKGPRFLIRDNDKKYGDSFERVASEIEVLKIPYRAPRANSYCERFIGSLRRECLDHVIILNERHLHRTVKEYATYFNTDRPHQGIDQRIPGQSERPGTLESPPSNGKLISRPVLNGLHHTYYWAATQSVGHSQTQRPIVH